MTAESLCETFDVNVGTTHRITSALLPALHRSRAKKIIMMYGQYPVNSRRSLL